MMEAPSSAAEGELKKPGLNIKLSLDNDDTIELIDNSELTEAFKRDVLSPYLRHLYDDLSTRGAHPAQGITKTTFLEFLNMKGLIGDRLFHLYDLDKNECVDLIEFITVSCRFFQTSFESKLKLVFDMFDVNSDGLISGEDIRGILSHIPLELINTCRTPKQCLDFSFPTTKVTMEVYLDRVKSQEELGQLIAMCLKEKADLTFDDFRELTEKVCSDMFLCVYLYLRSNFQLCEQFYLYAKKIKKVAPANSPSRKHVISSPRVLSRFSPVASLIKRTNSCKRIPTSFASSKDVVCRTEGREELKTASVVESKCKKSTFTNVESFTDQMLTPKKQPDFCQDFTSALAGETGEENDAPEEGIIHAQKPPTLKVNSNDLSWLKEQKSSKDGSLLQEEMSGDVVRISTHTKKVSQFYVPPVETEDGVDSPIDDTTSEDCKSSPGKRKLSEETKDSAGTSQSFELYCECGNLCDSEKSLCNKCLEKQKPVEFSGHLFAQISQGVKLYWFRLLNKELYCYNGKEDGEYFRMFQLSGVFVKEEMTEDKIEGVTTYSFSLHTGKNRRLFYARSIKKRDLWVQAIRQAIGYSSFFTFYSIKGLLGKGSFAEVRAAEHKIAKKNVAVKILRKKQMTEKQVARARSEIETLKMCQHPNVMRLFEVFENTDHIYLVVEYLAGGSLYSFLKERHFSIPERMACRYVRSIANALHYIHTYGIIHRDVKPDNIVLAAPTDDSDVKIVDFGLAQILGPNEFATDPVGTLCYAAPEILLGQKYTRAVDMWSLGVLTHLMLVGVLPFSPELSEKQIAEQIIGKDLDFSSEAWNRVSREGRAFVKALIRRDPTRRMTSDEVFQHPWMRLNK